MGPFFFCGIGGSGMLPLALILRGHGVSIGGSDRARDQGRTPEKFTFLEKQGVTMAPQDGTGLTHDYAALVVSSAIEDSIPEVSRAKELGIPIIKRAELLAQLFNAAKTSIAVGGTSGKSTTTGMIAWILSQAGKNPTVMNGANFLNFVTPENPYATALVGTPDLFVSECDESDGSIILYHPHIAILTNIAIDHKPVEELLPIFMQYLKQSAQTVVNIDNLSISEHILPHLPQGTITFSMGDTNATFCAHNIIPSHDSSTAEICGGGVGRGDEEGGMKLTLNIPGHHNIENALAAIGACYAIGIPPEQSIAALANFHGIARRLQTVKKYNNISIIDDFAHNPDKIRASLGTLKQFKGRLLVMFQMHGYGPFNMMKDELLGVFASMLERADHLYMPDVLYLGGTADKSYTAADFIAELRERGVNATYAPERADIAPLLRAEAKSGDRIIVMGARDDTLTAFAKSILT
jgi:UDP-N-acetylmuramate--alanine ligase